MTAEILHLNRPRTVDAAWQRYVDLVQERADRNLWADLGHNQRIAVTFDEWRELFLASLKNS